MSSKSEKEVKPQDLNDVELVFGNNSPKTGVRPDVHLIANEKKQDRGPAIPGRLGSESDTAQPTQPLLEPDRGKPTPPLAGPEIDDLDDEKPAAPGPYPGIDDGLLDIPEKKPDINGNGGVDLPGSEEPSTREDGVGTEDGKWAWSAGDELDGPYDGLNGFGPRFGLDDRPGSPMIPGSIPDVNTYQQKKNLAQGMMDLALLSANANQLRYVLESSDIHPYYYPSLVFISLSILLQVAVGVGLILNSRYNVKDDKDICKADKINNMTVLGVFLITIVNVFIASFSVATPTTLVPAAP